MCEDNLMCVATVIVVGGAVASSVIAAKAQSAAAKRASDAQTAAANEALAVQKQQYAQKRADFEPYAAAGRQALGRMQGMAAQPRMTFDPTNAASWTGPARASGDLGDSASPLARTTPQTFDGSTPPQLGLPQAPPAGLGMSQPAQAAQPAGEMTLMQAPDGSPPRPVPSHLVQQLIAKGAKVVS